MTSDTNAQDIILLISWALLDAGCEQNLLQKMVYLFDLLFFGIIWSELQNYQKNDAPRGQDLELEPPPWDLIILFFTFE